MVFYATFNSISIISRRQLTLFMLSWVSPVLGWGSEVSCPRTLPRKNPEDPVRLEPRTSGLRVKHFTTEPRRTPPHFVALKIYSCGKHCDKGEIAYNKHFLLFSQCFLPYVALIFHFKYTLKCRLQFVSIWTSLKYCCLEMGYFNPFPNKPWFLRVSSVSL